jgi:uncharacterized protein (DUF697 family)
MADDVKDKKAPAGTIKVKRTRRRVYEEAPAAPAAAPAAAAEAAVVIATPPPAEPAALPAEGARQPEALRLVRKYVLYSAGAGVVPVPCLDMLAVAVLQQRMLKKLCALYGLNYSRQRAKTLVTALIGGTYAGLIAGSIGRLIPVVGLLSLAAIPAVSGALTYAVGKVFIQHFESGGTFLDFDPAKVRRYFAEQYEQARKINPAA